MESHLDTIIIRDDDESPAQGGSQRQRAPRPDYSYRGWEKMIDDAAASATEDVATPSARKRKRDTTDEKSFTPLINTLGRLYDELKREAQQSRHKIRNLEEELEEQKEQHRQATEAL